MKRAKLSFLLDTVIVMACPLSAVSGAVFLSLPQGGFRDSQDPGAQPGVLLLSRAAWRKAHTWASLILVAGRGIRLALHCSWIACIARRYAKSAVRHSGAGEKETRPLQAGNLSTPHGRTKGG